MASIHKKRKLEQLAVSESCSSLATAWHDIDDIRRRVLSQSTLNTADLLRCELVCKHWRDLQLPIRLPIRLQIKQQSHVAWLQHNVSRVSSLSIDIADIVEQGRLLEYGTFGTCDAAVSQSNIHSLQQLDHIAIADVIGEAKLATTLTIEGFHVEKLPESLSGLTGLQQLTIQGLPALLEVSFDVVAALTCLTYLSIAQCCSLWHLGDGLSKLTQLKLLKAGCRGYHRLCVGEQQQRPSALEISSKIGGLTGLQHLRLVHTNLPHTLVQLDTLQTLELIHPHTSMSKLQNLSQLQCLSNLFLHTDKTSTDDYRLIDLGGLQSLKKLTLVCDNVRALPDSTTRISTLQHLEICGYKCLSSLPEELGALSGLTHLTVSGSHSGDKEFSWTGEAYIWKVPESLGALIQLQELFLQHCPQLYWLPESVGGLGDLKRLSVQDCRCLQSLPGSIGSLTSLENVSLVSCMSLQELPDSFSQLTALTRVHIDRCGILELPDLGQLKKLECVTLNCCRQLRALPTSAGQLISLKSLDVTACYALKDLPDELGQLSALRLCLKDCTGLKALPASVSELEPDVAGCFGLLPCSFKEQPKFILW